MGSRRPVGESRPGDDSKGAERPRLREPRRIDRRRRLPAGHPGSDPLRQDQADRPGQPDLEGLHTGSGTLFRISVQDRQAGVSVRRHALGHQAAARPVSRIEHQLLHGPALGGCQRRTDGRDAVGGRVASAGIRRAVALLRFPGASRRHAARLRTAVRASRRADQGPHVRVCARQQLPHQLSPAATSGSAVPLFTHHAQGEPGPTATLATSAGASPIR